MTGRKLSTVRISRDTILFIAGLSGIGYETLAQNGERPTLLILFAAMVGLPAFLRADEKIAVPPKEPITPPEATP